MQTGGLYSSLLLSSVFGERQMNNNMRQLTHLCDKIFANVAVDLYVLCRQLNGSSNNFRLFLAANDCKQVNKRAFLFDLLKEICSQNIRFTNRQNL